MKTVSSERMRELHEGVKELHFTDFPDHANVGDSAIALGQFRFWKDQGIKVQSVHCIPTLSNRVLTSPTPVLVHGGGNFGGLYKSMSEHRYSLAESVHPGKLLIQAPQSVHFISEAAKEEFVRRMANRSSLRVGARDQNSFAHIASYIEQLSLIPDSVHILGAIPSALPTQERVVLGRSDKESSGAFEDGESVDWLADRPVMRASTWLRWRGRRWEATRRLANLTPNQWQRRAQSRMDRGVSVLSKGETIVTDRLHAMLIGLQMGRRIIAIDNNNKKLSHYADTWFGDVQPNVRFAKTMSEANILTQRGS